MTVAPRHGFAALMLLTVLAGPASSAAAADPFAAAMRRDAAGLRNSLYDGDLARLAHRFRKPADDLAVSSRLLIEAQRAILARAAAAASGPTLRARDGVRYPSGMFAALHDALLPVFRDRLGLRHDTAAILAAVIERQAIRLAGLDEATYAAAVGRPPPAAATVTSALQAALGHLYATSTVDVGFAVPFIAGYAADDPAYVFIDCAVPLLPRLAGRPVPVVRLLVLHERIEKALLDAFGIRYQSAHQIALRLERGAADALGVDWAAYDSLTDQIADRLAARAPVPVSNRLDLTPYDAYGDGASRRLVARMRRGLRDHAAYARPIDKAAPPQAGRCPAPKVPRPGG